jgi:hypothetical protein
MSCHDAGMTTSVYLEVGSTKVFASALDWPGWCRAAKSEEGALEALADYVDRYRPVTERAGVRLAKNAASAFDVIERVKGSGTTDFGAPGEPAKADDTRLTKAQAARLAALVSASWDTLADVVAGAPATLRKGPRGGGRDRDKIVEHVRDAEVAYGRAIGVRYTPTELRQAGAFDALRAELLSVLSAARDPRPESGKAWPFRYAARRIAWHVLDHAWEIEDKSSP